MDNKTMAAAFEQQIQKYQNSKLIKPHKTVLEPWFWINDVPQSDLNRHDKYAKFGNEKPILVIGPGKGFGGGDGLVFTNEKLYFLTVKDSFMTRFFPTKGEVGSIPLNQIKDLRVGEHYSTLQAYFGTQIFLNGKNIGLVHCGRATVDEDVVNALEYIFKVFSNPSATSEQVENVDIARNNVDNIQDQMPQPSYTPPQHAPKKKKKTWLWVLLGIVAAIIAFFVCVGTTPAPDIFEEEIKDLVKYEITYIDYQLYAFNGREEEEANYMLTIFYQAIELVKEKYEKEEGLVTYRQIIKDLISEDDADMADYITVWREFLMMYDYLEIELSEFEEIKNNSDYELYSFKELKRDLDFTYEYNLNNNVSHDCEWDNESVDEYIDNKINPG